MALKDLEPIRHKTWFGTGANGQCTSKSKRTGMRCGCTPMAGMKVCYHHGGASVKARRMRKEGLLVVKSPRKAGLDYLRSLTVSDAYSDVVSKYPELVNELATIRCASQRGRIIHEAINGNRNNRTKTTT